MLIPFFLVNIIFISLSLSLSLSSNNSVVSRYNIYVTQSCNGSDSVCVCMCVRVCVCARACVCICGVDGISGVARFLVSGSSDSNSRPPNVKYELQGRQCTNNVTLRRVRVTIGTVEKQ
jgi:hypothetical protein